MPLHTLHQRPEGLDRPVLVVQFEGWIDAGLAAAAAMARLLSSWETTAVASFDVDALLDHRARRPVLRVTDGMNAGVTWPSLELRLVSQPTERTTLILTGPEPDHQWRAFTDEVVSLATELDVTLVVGLGAFPAPVPHTRPCQLASTATTPELARQVGFISGTLDVPASVQAVLERGFAGAGIPAVGLWAKVPHYVATMAYPAASVALLDGLAAVTGLKLDAPDLRRAAEESRRRVDAMADGNPQQSQLVRELEAHYDAEGSELEGLTTLPSGDEIAAEVERFLRGEAGPPST